MADTHFDVLVLGAGPGGYPAAIRAAQLGQKVACVERELLGGVCLNWGCIPSKALLKTAELAHKIRHADDFGLQAGELGIDYAKVIGRSRKVSKRFERGVGGLFKKYGVTRIEGTGRIAGEGALEVSHDGETTRYTADHIVLATGARARTFPGLTPDGERILTYREAIVLDERPPSVVILGAGAIGMEFAYFMNAMGTEVTVVEGQDEVLPLEDPECAAVVRKSMGKSGVTFELGTLVDEVVRDGDGCTVRLSDGRALSAHTVLLALGVTPNTDDLGLDAVGIETDDRGFIRVDASHRTTARGFYAVGDVCDAGPALAHTATRQAHVCVERIAGHEAIDVDYSAMPSCTYCQPQVASVGQRESDLKEAGTPYRVGKFPFTASGKAVAAAHSEGFVKLLVSEDHGEILGAHIVGAEATELITEYVLAMDLEATADEIHHSIHAHPTLSEALMEAAAATRGEAIHI